jgi:hypothetical protein
VEAYQNEQEAQEVDLRWATLKVAVMRPLSIALRVERSRLDELVMAWIGLALLPDQTVPSAASAPP